MERQFDIEAKLAALLELSKSTAEGTEHEAATALEMAIRLAAKHGISLTKLADKRKAYAGDWFSRGTSSADSATPQADVEFSEERYLDVAVKRWCDLAESHGWERHKRTEDSKEGFIWMYRQPNREPKIEVRIFGRPWGDVEFEVVRRPDPIIGNLEQWMNMGFDCIELGVTYHDFANWLFRDKMNPFC